MCLLGCCLPCSFRDLQLMKLGCSRVACQINMSPTPSGLPRLVPFFPLVPTTLPRYQPSQNPHVMLLRLQPPYLPTTASWMTCPAMKGLILAQKFKVCSSDKSYDKTAFPFRLKKYHFSTEYVVFIAVKNDSPLCHYQSLSMLPLLSFEYPAVL